MIVRDHGVSKIGVFARLILILALALFIYVYNIQPAEESSGLYPIAEFSNPWYWTLGFFWVGVVALLMPRSIKQPSDLFMLVFLLASVIWSAACWPITQILDSYQAFYLVLITAFPVVVIKFFGFISARGLSDSHYAQCNSHDGLVYVLTSILVFAVFFSFIVAGSAGNFSIEYSYVRRLAARANFSEHIFAAYLFQMSVNGFAPFLAYCAGLRKSYRILIAAIFFEIYAFWLIGVKAPVCIAFAVFMLGIMLKKDQLHRLPKYVLNLLLLTFVCACIEILLTDYSYIADYGLRRAIFLNSQIQTYFFDAMQSNPLGLLSGLSIGDYISPEFLVGDKYFHSASTNANVNAFQHQFAMGGISEYLLVLIGVVCLVVYCDMLAKLKINTDGYMFCLLYAILLAEQAFTTLLLSSGIFFCHALSLLFSLINKQKVRVESKV